MSKARKGPVVPVRIEDQALAERVAALLPRAQSGDAAARDELVGLLYETLRSAAQAYVRRNERPDHTLQPTALVNETLMQLHVSEHLYEARNRETLLYMIGQAMWRVLRDHARKRRIRPDRTQRASLDAIDATVAWLQERRIDVLDEALDVRMAQLEQIEPRHHKAVMLRYFDGLSNQEVAQLLGISEKQVERDLNAARTWLSSRIELPPGNQKRQASTPRASD